MAETQAFTSLAQRVAANDPTFSKSLASTVLAPIIDALAKVGITATKPRVLELLAQNSEAMLAGSRTNAQVGSIVTSGPMAEAANNSTYKEQPKTGTNN